MNVLEKILEEIENHAKLGSMRLESIRIEKVEEIIRSYMENQEKFEFDFTGVKAFDCQCGRHYVNTAHDNWVPCSKRLPEQEGWVLATVMHSAWISDYDSKWVKEEEKIHHQKSFGTYLAYVNALGEWIFLDECYSEVICGKEVGNDPGKVYDVAIAWKPLPEPYRAADSKSDWKENMLNTFLTGH